MIIICFRGGWAVKKVYFVIEQKHLFSGTTGKATNLIVERVNCTTLLTLYLIVPVFKRKIHLWPRSSNHLPPVWSCTGVRWKNVTHISLWPPFVLLGCCSGKDLTQIWARPASPFVFLNTEHTMPLHAQASQYSQCNDTTDDLLPEKIFNTIFVLLSN